MDDDDQRPGGFVRFCEVAPTQKFRLQSFEEIRTDVALVYLVVLAVIGMPDDPDPGRIAVEADRQNAVVPADFTPGKLSTRLKIFLATAIWSGSLG